jgi:tetratricopeptide (TPR) repeat protein
VRIARWPVLAAIAVATGAGAAQAPAPPPLAAPEPARANPLLWNARERTAAGLARLDAGDLPGAAEALDTAWQLEPDHPQAAFNAGTGRLLAGRPDALPALEAAARAVAEAGERGEDLAGLAPDAFYNLGNARLAAGDAAGAVEAYAETLRRAPRREDAKRNLELALRALEQQRQQQQQSPSSSEGDPDARNEREGGSAPRAGRGEGDPNEDEKASEEGEDEDRTGGEPREEGASDPKPGDRGGGSPNGTGASSSPTDAPPTPPSTESLSPSSSSSTGEPSSSAERPPASGPAAPGGSRRRERLPGFVDQEEMTADEAAALLDAVEDLERQQRRQRALVRARRRAEVEKDW